jgi:hypothetical protein
VLYYTRISRHVSANSKPSSSVVAYRILKVSNHIKKILTDPLNLCYNFFLAVAVVNEVKTNISLANMKLKHEDELDKSINVKLKYTCKLV